jgi:hypothetical protein
MFAGDATPEPRATAAGVIRDAGFEPTYVGPIRYARNLEVWRNWVSVRGCASQVARTLAASRVELRGVGKGLSRAPHCC